MRTWTDVTGTWTAGGVDGTRSQWLLVAEDSPTAGNVPKPPQISFEIPRAAAKGARDSTPTSGVRSRCTEIA